MTFFESFKDVLINIVTILMISAKKATIGLLKIKVFYDEDYGIIVSVHDIISTILSCDSDYNAYTIIIDNTYTFAQQGN